ncbi:large T antigen [Sumatran orang-utan polyomavirus]|uniref:Large T antigen n=1 Tax=Sumatran orang-utan polyomavirus TaxID=1604875 RepID=C9X3X1_9POLY|nr:large T antigen [Sumatran orang-utan polyomavirus]CAX87759.1 large T antigen [Sumatran orang-utan polyomavirus]
MDKILTKQQRKELIVLLDIEACDYGNYSIMKQQYKKMCLIYHPDKGGDGEKMRKLNSLWQAFNTELLEIRDNRFDMEQDESPIYGTPQFKEWWYAQFSFCASPPKYQRTTTDDRRRGPDIRCDEVLESSDEEGPTTSTHSSSFKRRRKTPHSTTSTDFFSSTPKTSESSSSSYARDSGRDSACSPDFSFSFTSPPSTQCSPPKPPGEADSAASQASFSSTPPKTKGSKVHNDPLDFLNCLFDYLSHAIYSNKTLNSFLLYTTCEKGKVLYEKVEKFKPEFKSRHKYEEGNLIFIITLGKHRVSAIKNFCAGFCTVSFLLCKAVNKPMECYNCLSKGPFTLIEENKPGLFQYEFSDLPEEQSCNWNLIASFAQANNLDDPLMIMAHYLDFNETYPCAKCDKKQFKVHYMFHKDHMANASLFYLCKQQKAICQQAADVVVAKRRLRLLEATREELLAEKVKAQFDKLKDLGQIKLLQFVAGVAWYSCLFENIEELVMKILQLLTENIPKKRNVLFRGPVNTGKTSLAAAFMDLIDGKALNVNCPPEKLPFELGCAIDQFAIVFEDVKGQISMSKSLQPGQGISNLDNMRDYMDGAVKVNLEKKHMNKRAQIFPPCIVTCNEYLLPQTLFVRFALVLNFPCKEFLKNCLEKNPEMLKLRVLQSGLTTVLLLLWYMPVSSFMPELESDVKYWKEILDKECGLGRFHKMLGNIRLGLDPLYGIVVCDEEENHEDSGNYTQ